MFNTHTQQYNIIAKSMNFTVTFYRLKTNKEYVSLSLCSLGACSITDEGFRALASALRSNPSHMRELQLSGNNAGNSGVKHLSSLLEDPNCKLEKLE